MKKFLALMLAMLMALSLVACGGGNNAADDNNANNGDDAAMTKLVLGTSADYAPFEFMYPDESGEMVYGGIDVNCTFASLFEAAGDTLQDLAGGMLFR